MKQNRTTAFTIIELLVVVSIIALLIGILLPAIGKARDAAKESQSFTNLRNLGVAHQTYAAEHGDRQFTLIDDNLSSYGLNIQQALTGYDAAHGGQNHPSPILGYGVDPPNYSDQFLFGYWQGPPDFSRSWAIQPIVYTVGFEVGAFRIANVRQFNNYLSGRTQDKVFYAPKCEIQIDAISHCFSEPTEVCSSANESTSQLSSQGTWPTYILSPAAMFHPEVYRNLGDGGYQSPFSFGGGFRSPAMSQALHPSLKTHMLEHFWLQNTRSDCNPLFVGGTFDDCEPWYFNHDLESAPVTLFYDGHVDKVGVKEAQNADGRMIAQTTGLPGGPWGLWSRDTPLGPNGYFNNFNYPAQQGAIPEPDTSFHVLTTDGIRGRDVSAN